jgi:hypothetical protein
MEMATEKKSIPEPRSPLFILGPPRSGTTVLVSALRKAGYFGFNEGHLLNLLAPLKRFVEEHFNLQVTDKDQLLANIDRDKFLEEIFVAFRIFQARLNANEPWLDKTPDKDMILGVPILTRLWPTAVFIFAKRRGIENIVSRMKKFPAERFHEHCKHWTQIMAAWREIRDSNIQSIEVDQYDIAHDPEEIARRLGTFLALPKGAVKKIGLELMNSHPEQTAPDSARAVLSLQTCGWTHDQIKLFRNECWIEMEAYGYTFDEKYREDKKNREPTIEGPI